MGKLPFCYVKTKAQISVVGTVKLISAFCFHCRMSYYGLMGFIPNTYCIVYQQAFIVIK